jgi:hypothetical protein
MLCRVEPQELAQGSSPDEEYDLVVEPAYLNEKKPITALRGRYVPFTISASY